ncbi:MAG: guanylate kinase [Clostridia bacterium]|nr:guanylate kinase [Clostridia bacterium]
MSNNKRAGVLLVVSGPSGAGKGTVCTALRKIREDLKLSISVTTRQPRNGEVDGVHYFFKTVEEFAAMRDAGEFLEWAEVYGNFYGTPISFVKKTLEEGSDMLLEIDIQGALNVKKLIPEAVLVFIVPPSIEILHKRLAARGTETPEALALRCASATAELDYMEHYDYLVINDELDRATEDVAMILASEARRVSRNTHAYKMLLEGKEL